MITYKRGKITRRFEKVSDRARIEGLDCFVYSYAAMKAIDVINPKSAIRFLFTQTLPAGRGIFSPFCVSERAPPVRYALRRQFRSHPQAFWGVLAAAPPPTPSSWRQRRRECRTRDHDVSGMTHPSCMKRAQRSRIAVNTASMAELIFKNVCLPAAANGCCVMSFKLQIWSRGRSSRRAPSRARPEPCG